MKDNTENCGADPRFVLVGPARLIDVYIYVSQNLQLICILAPIYYPCSRKKLSVTRPLSFLSFRYDSIIGSLCLRGVTELLRF